jgi:hypothetical protein
MKRCFILVVFVITILVFSNCNKKQEETCLSHTTAKVTNVDGPNMVSVDHEIDLTVKYYLNNGCGQFERLESTLNDHTIIISLIAKYEGYICTDILLGGQTIYKFKPLQTGVYYLKFLQPDKTYLIDTITVN